MKRRNGIRLLALLILLCLALASCASPKSACETGNHNWQEATCQTPKLCLVCGASEGASLPHNWQEATCEAESVCADCSMTRGMPVGHREDATVIKAPTCTEKGCLLYRCRVCNKEHTAEIEANGHKEGPGYCLDCGVELENKIKNVIYIIGDGMGLEHIAAGQMAYGTHYAFTDWKRATVNTDSLASSGNASTTTDSAAAGTALATGTLTTNGRVGMGSDGISELYTVLDFAKEMGKKTGILTTDALYGATPGAFSAHVAARSDYEAIVAQQFTSGVDLLIGSYNSLCAGEQSEAKKNGYAYVENLIAAYESIGSDKLYAQLTLEGNTKGKDAVKLSEAAALALTFLNNEQGFVLVIEQAHIDKFAHGNDIANTVAMVNSLNETVNTVLDWAQGRTDTAIVITSDHETGGLSISSKSTLPSRYRGKGGTVYYTFESEGHTESDVGLFLWGTSFDFSTLPYMKSSHQVKNCDVPKMIMMILLR